MKKIKIAIIPPNILPIPAVKGGAIETLTTYLVNQNEIEGNCHIYIYNKDCYKKELENYSYKKTTINIIDTRWFDSYLDKFYLLIRKILCYKVPYNSAFLSRVCDKIKKENIDYILVEGNPHYVWKISNSTGIKPCLHIHTDHVLDSSTKSYAKIIKNTSKIICVSNYIKNQICKIPIVNVNSIHTCLNCTDFQIFNPGVSKRYRDSMRKKLGIKDDDIVYAFIGRVTPMKGVKELVEAFKLSQVHNKRLLIVGGANFGDSVENEFINYLKEETNQSAGKIIMTGYIDQTKLPAYYSAADIYVLPSKYDEAAPLANIEAMSMGLKCIVSDKGGTLEYIDDNCMVVDVDNNAVENILCAMNRLASVIIENKLNINNKMENNNKWSIQRYYSEMLKIIKDEKI